MNDKIFNEIKAKEKLAVILDESGAVVWESTKSPASALYKAYFKGEFQNRGGLTIYVNQAGLAVAVIAEKLNIKECYAFRMSACGLDKFKNYGGAFHYEELIPLVKSSKDESKVCPIEQFLFEHPDLSEQWEFLRNRFDNDSSADASCSITAHLI